MNRRPVVALLSHAYFDLEARKMVHALDRYVHAVVVTLSRYPVPPQLRGQLFKPTILEDDSGRFIGFPPLYRPGSPFVAQYALASLSLGFRRLRPDIIHIEYPPWSPVFWQALLARRLFAPRARIVHFAKKNTYRRHAGLGQRVKDALTGAGLRRVDLVMAASQMAADVYVRELGMPCERVVVTTAVGVDGDAFRPLPAPRSKDDLVVGYCGRLEPSKGVTDLIEAIGLLRQRQGLGARLRVLGGGSLAGDLEKRARTTEWLEVLPGVYSSEVPGFLHSLDLFVLPARVLPDHEEHDAHALLEAQAVGLPCVGTRSGVIPELISDGSGILVPPEDPEALAAAIEHLATDPDRRTAIARRGLVKARAQYLLEPVARAHAQIYMSLVT
jgi:glycosyltransferase involved in cell wall biosynthesis